MATDTVIETVEADTVLGKYKITGASLNNLATFVTLMGVVLLCWVFYGHADDAKKSGKEVAIELRDTNKEIAKVLKEQNKEITDTLREMARATREQNCLLSLPQDQRQRNAETCRRISQ